MPLAANAKRGYAVLCRLFRRPSLRLWSENYDAAGWWRKGGLAGETKARADRSRSALRKVFDLESISVADLKKLCSLLNLRAPSIKRKVEWQRVIEPAWIAAWGATTREGAELVVKRSFAVSLAAAASTVDKFQNLRRKRLLELAQAAPGYMAWKEKGKGTRKLTALALSTFLMPQWMNAKEQVDQGSTPAVKPRRKRAAHDDEVAVVEADDEVVDVADDEVAIVDVAERVSQLKKRTRVTFR